MSLPELALRNRTLTVFALFILVSAGIGAFFKLGQLEDPDFTNKVAIVSTPYPGATASEVEVRVPQSSETTSAMSMVYCSPSRATASATRSSRPTSTTSRRS